MRYKYRIRHANNIITFFEYEKSVGNYFHTFKNNLIKRMNDIAYNYAFFDFRKLSKFLYDNNQQHTNILDFSDKALYDFLSNFEKHIQQQISIFDNDVADKDPLKVLQSNMNTKKDNLIDLINANLTGNSFFVTLTYNDDNVMYLDDLTESHQRHTDFILKLNDRLFGRNEKRTIIKDLKYVTRWELQKANNRNALHYHIVMFDLPFKKFDLDMLRSIWPYGSVNVKRITKNTSGVGKYMAEYLGKDMEDFVSGKKSYFSSKNLIRPFNDYVVEYDKDNNTLLLKSGIVVDLNDYNIEKIENFESYFNGKTKKIIYNKQ